MAMRLDETDRKILAELQADASQSLDEIAKKIGSSKTPVWNRIRKMREGGVIKATTAVLDADALGLEAGLHTIEHSAVRTREARCAAGVPLGRAVVHTDFLPRARGNFDKGRGWGCP